MEPNNAGVDEQGREGEEEHGMGVVRQEFPSTYLNRQSRNDATLYR